MVAQLLLFLLIVSSPPQQAQQQNSAQEWSTVPGTVDVAEGSPVALSDARRVLLKEPPGADGRSWIVIRAETTIENTSGRPIRRLCLALSYGGNKTQPAVADGIRVAADGIRANEVRRYSDTTMHVRGGPVPDGPDWDLTIRVRGAEFEDGTHWAAPRLSSSPLSVPLIQQRGTPLDLRNCIWRNDSYSAVLWAVEPRIVAYRLGSVKDIPGDFEVRLGKWVELSEGEHDRGSTFTEDGTSLGPNDLFAKESAQRTLSDGRVITQSFGVAIFVAEVRFANGRVWHQDLSRDALFWNN